MGGGWGQWESESLGQVEKVEENTLEEIMASRRRAAQAIQWAYLAKVSGFGSALTTLLQNLGAIAPGKYEQKTMARLLTNEGEVLFLTIVCPDYAVKKEGGVVSYTFDSLGDGIGVVAGRALDTHIQVAKFFGEHGMAEKVHFVLVMADQEANYENSKRVGISQEEFLARLRRSQAALAREASAQGLEIQTPLLTEMQPGRWEASQQEGSRILQRVAPGLLEAARRARHPFYERWAGRSLKPEESMAMLQGQVQEYIAVAHHLSVASGRVLLGLDAPIMAPFVRHGAGNMPVVYFERPDY